MCGIFGFVVNERSSITRKSWEKNLRRLIRYSEPRGREASGLAMALGEKIAIYKQAIKPSKMLRQKSFAVFLRNGSPKLPRPIAAIGHCRLVTNGTQAIPEHNQPICTSQIVGIHNGIITNDTALLQEYPMLMQNRNAAFGSDSAVLFSLIQQFYETCGNLEEATAKVFEKIEGSASIAMLHHHHSRLTLATNTGSLYYSFDPQAGFFIFASERFIVERFLKRAFCKIVPVKAGECVQIGFEDILPKSFNMGDVTASSKGGAVSASKKDPLYAIVDESTSRVELRRCSRCVLPETYPFISFDAEGICNFCGSYKKQIPYGREALEKILSQYRSKDGSPDCMVGLSGGRDSTYGIHMLVKEFGMHPIVYTYDWALVTDLARRNQARLVGKLGLEHIIRAADIHAKRRYIRKNIYAWLKRPELGMVPIFMAGDKPFYYYGRKLRRETGINFTIFCAGHQVEQMEFKAGFCGVDQSLINNTKLYHFSFLNKFKLAVWYSKQYLLNPSYINEALLDSVVSFYCSFINKDDYLYLYYYLPWDEKVITETLQTEYGWEADAKYGDSQWRMGDGQTAFTNYIWHTIAGFSEFDTYRSNQIREGMISREEAVKRIQEDNRPKLQMLQDFSLLIGFNLEEVLLKINRIPKLYEKKSPQFRVGK